MHSKTSGRKANKPIAYIGNGNVFADLGRPDADEALAKQGLVPPLSLKLSKVKTEDLANRYQIEEKRLEVVSVDS